MDNELLKSVSYLVFIIFMNTFWYFNKSEITTETLFLVYRKFYKSYLSYCVNTIVIFERYLQLNLSLLKKNYNLN